MVYSIITLTAFLLTASPPPESKLPASLELERLRAVPVQHNGRWPPLDTAARDIVESVTGESTYRDRDPLLWLLAWTFDSQTWRQQPLISISNQELRTLLQLPSSKTVFSFAELGGHDPLMAKITALARIQRGKKLNPLEAKVRDIEEKLVQLQQAFHGQVIKLIPDPVHANGSWNPIAKKTEPKDEAHADHSDAATQAWDELGKAFRADDAKAFDAATDKLISVLQGLPSAHQPNPKLIQTELGYNKLRPFRSAWIVMLVGSLLCAAATRSRATWATMLADLALLAGFGILSYGLWLRWQIAGRIPAANMFESLLFLSWGMGVFAIISMIVFHDRVIPLTASAMGAISLILADCLPLDHFVRPPPPVLMDTIWMSIHVPIIMISYSVLALAVLIAHGQLLVMAAAPEKQSTIDAIDRLHYWYIHIGAFLLMIGIMTGSMWAASSWGRYWGWDPKEVWSLIAFFAYLAIMHVRIDTEKISGLAKVIALILGHVVMVIILIRFAPLTLSKLLITGLAGWIIVFFLATRGQFSTALKSIVAFWSIVMTYVGVNYVLGIGLHAYGFGTGAVVHYMILIAGLDLLLIAICSLAYLARRNPQPVMP